MRVGINLLFLVAGRGGGIERYARGLINGLQRIDKRNEYFLFTNKDCRGSFELTDNFKEVYCNVSAVFRPSKILWEQTVLPFQIKRERLDVLLSPGNIAPIVHPCPSVAILHDMIPYIRPEGFNMVELLSLKTLFHATARYSSKVITVSDSSRKEILNRFNLRDNKVVVIPGAISETFRPVSVTADNKKKLNRYGIHGRYILYLASSRGYKNIDGLIKAYKILKERYHIAQSLVVSGTAGQAHHGLMKLIDDLSLKREVILSGFIEDGDIPLLYSAADIFVYPSFYEGFGLPVLEAMACGTPVAASNATSIPEAVGNAGLLFDPDNIEEMAEKIFKILDDKELRDELIRKGFEHVKGFSWEKTAEEVLSLITEISKKDYAKKR